MAAGRLVIAPWFPARDRNGRLVSGALFTVWTNNTTTKASIYAEEALTTPLANPVAANSSGVFPAVWAEAGTTESPTLYSVGISGPNGESIANPGVLDDWQPSVDGVTAQTAIAESAAQSSADYYDDILAIAGDYPDPAALATRAAKAANLSDLTNALAARESLGDFGTRALAAAKVVPALLTSLVLHGYAAAGDGGRADYKRAASEPAHAGKLQTADGAWWELAEPVVRPKMFGAPANGTDDDLSALQDMVDYSTLTGVPCHSPARFYKLSGTLEMPEDITFLGDGPNRTFFTVISASVVPAIHIAVGDSSSNVGLNIGGFTIICTDIATGLPAVCDGIKLTTTATNSAVNLANIHDIVILYCRRGFWSEGVIYQISLRRVRVTYVSQYGFLLTGSQEIIYNKCQNLEATGVANGAYAFYSGAPATQWETISGDGCCYFAGAYTSIDGLSVEGIFATTPVSTNCVEINQISSLTNVALINIPNAKCNVGILANGNINILGVRFPDHGAGNQPDRPVLFASGTTGLMSGVQMVNCVSRLARADLEGVFTVACEDITDYGFTRGAGTWTPDFSSWNTAPTAPTGYYTTTDDVVHLFLKGNGGFAADYDTIGGIPFPASSLAGGVGILAGQAITNHRICQIASGTSVVSGIAQVDLTSDFWEFQATYKRDLA